jgi:hypothetical protein
VARRLALESSKPSHRRRNSASVGVGMTLGANRRKPSGSCVAKPLSRTARTAVGTRAALPAGCLLSTGCMTYALGIVLLFLCGKSGCQVSEQATITRRVAATLAANPEPIRALGMEYSHGAKFPPCPQHEAPDLYSPARRTRSTFPFLPTSTTVAK